MEKEKTMTIVVTSTFYKEADVRAGLALETLSALSRLKGTKCVIVDGGSYSGFLQDVRNFGLQIHQQTSPGMDAARLEAFQMAIALAAPGEPVVWVEPEKVGFVSQIPKVVKPIENGEADMVIPNRRKTNSYPPEQHHSEAFAAYLISKLHTAALGKTELNVDAFFGPIAGTAEVMQISVDFDPTKYGLDQKKAAWWGIYLFRLEVFANPKLRVRVVTCDYTHPEAQTREEEGDLAFMLKRLEQLVVILPPMVAVAYHLGLIPDFDPKFLERFGIVVPPKA